MNNFNFSITTFIIILLLGISYFSLSNDKDLTYSKISMDSDLNLFLKKDKTPFEEEIILRFFFKRKLIDVSSLEGKPYREILKMAKNEYKKANDCKYQEDTVISTISNIIGLEKKSTKESFHFEVKFYNSGMNSVSIKSFQLILRNPIGDEIITLSYIPLEYKGRPLILSEKEEKSEKLYFDYDHLKAFFYAKGLNINSNSQKHILVNTLSACIINIEYESQFQKEKLLPQ